MKILLSLTVATAMSIGFAGCKSTPKAGASNAACCDGTNEACCDKKSIPARIADDAVDVARQAGDAVVGSVNAVGNVIDKAVGGDGTD